MKKLVLDSSVVNGQHVSIKHLFQGMCAKRACRDGDKCAKCAKSNE